MSPFDIFRKVLTVKRKSSGIIDQTTFEWVDGVEETFTILASVQPTPFEIMETLPEGYRTKDSFTLFTETRLNTSYINDSREMFSPDIVIINNENYIVMKVADWQNNVINHYKIVVVKEGIDVIA